MMSQARFSGGNKIMGDKNPKSQHKQAAQKQAKSAVEAQKKKDAMTAKQAPPAKKK
jgi:hypothetical protein